MRTPIYGAGAIGSYMGALFAGAGAVQNGLPWWYFEGVNSPWRGNETA